MKIKKVLVVDDEDINQNIIEEIIGDLYELTFAYTAQECFERIDIEMPDLVLLDLSLPDLDGYSVLNKIRNTQKTKDLKVIIVSAHAYEENIQKGFDLGVDDYLSKPFSIKEIKTKIQNLDN